MKCISKVGKSNAAVFMNHAKIANMLISHAMKSTIPGLHDGYFRSKSIMTPL